MNWSKLQSGDVVKEYTHMGSCYTLNLLRVDVRNREWEFQTRRHGKTRNWTRELPKGRMNSDMYSVHRYGKKIFG